MNYDHCFVNMYTSHIILSMNLITNWCKNACQYFLSHLSQWLNIDPGSFKRGQFRAGQHWGEERVEEGRPQLPRGWRSTSAARRPFWIISHQDAQLPRTITCTTALGTVCRAHIGHSENKSSRSDEPLIFLSKNGRDLLLFYWKQLRWCLMLNSRQPGPTPRRPYKEATAASNRASIKGVQGHLLGCSYIACFCMHPQTQVPRDGLHLMQTHNLWNCVLIGYATYAQPYLPKSLRKIIEYHFFLSPRKKRFSYYIF